MQSTASSVRPRRVLLTVLAVVAALAGGLLLRELPSPQSGLPLPAPGSGVGDGASSADRVEVTLEERRLFGVRAFDDITPLDSPAAVTAAESRLHDGTMVVGVDLRGESKAYPITILIRHEMVNDIVGNVPVLVTWCPVCGTALVHDRRIDGIPRTFGNHRALYESAMTWYDHGTKSLWSQPSGVALAGPLAGVRLEMLPALVATWGAWKREQPDTLVVSEGIGSDSEAAVNPIASAPGAFVVGVAVSGATKAYPLDAVRLIGAVNDRVGEVPVLVYAGTGDAAVHVFDRTVEGSALVFELVGNGLRDIETGTMWDPASGRAVHGPHEGAELAELPYGTALRWAWERFYPGAEVYGS